MPDIILDLSQLITAEDMAATAADAAKDTARRDALTYLAGTDWYVARFAETGEAIPQEVSQARAEARAAL